MHNKIPTRKELMDMLQSIARQLTDDDEYNESIYTTFAAFPFTEQCCIVDSILNDLTLGVSNRMIVLKSILPRLANDDFRMMGEMIEALVEKLMLLKEDDDKKILDYISALNHIMSR